MSIGKLIRNALTFSNVAASGWATAPITVGKTIERIVLQMGSTVSSGFNYSHLQMIRVKANGKVFFEADGTQLYKINAYRGYAQPANQLQASSSMYMNYLTIDFTELKLRDRIDQMVGAFDTKGVMNMTIEVQIGAPSGTFNLGMQVVESASQYDAGKDYAGMMAKTLRYPWAASSGGVLPVMLPFGPQNGAIIKRAHIFHNGQLRGLTTKQDGMVIFEATLEQNSFLQQEIGRVPQTNCMTIDFVKDGNLADALNTRDAKSFEWLQTLGAADNGYVVIEYIDTLGNL